MRWRTEALCLSVGPDGIRHGERLLFPGPLDPSGLAAALQSLPELGGATKLAVTVDDAWMRGLCLSLPPGLLKAQEVSALAEHRLREIYDTEPLPWPVALTMAKSRPWRGGPFVDRVRIAAALPGAVQQAFEACSGKGGKPPSIRVGSAWGDALAGLPATAQGALAVLGAGRMTCGAWSGKRWLGWRSFAAGDPAAAQAELSRWLDGFAWQPEEAVVWCRGWTPQTDGRSDRVWRNLPAGTARRRAPAFDFPVGRAGGTGWPLSRRILVAAALATLAAVVMVSLPEREAADQALIVSALPRTKPALPVPAEPEPATEEAGDESPAAEESAVWPEMLGILEQGGRRYLLYNTALGASSARPGDLIEQRFRVERIARGSAVLTDRVTAERREIALELTGVQP